MVADLHLHTRHSDGTYTPAELVEAAVGHGLSAIALTDHDTLEGCAEVGRLAARAGIGFLAGTEITADLHGRELHILGYLVDPCHAGLREALDGAQKVRQDRVREMVARLNAIGIPLAAEAVVELAACRAPGRPHVARALVAGGHCTNLDEAFDRYLKKNRPGWVPKWKMSAQRAVELIHEAGGIAVMAHPGLNHDDGVIERLAGFGLDGLECHHPKHGPAAVGKYLEMARVFGLLVTGGSDCHGRSKNRPTMGTVRLAWEHVEALRARHASGTRGPVGAGAKAE